MYSSKNNNTKKSIITLLLIVGIGVSCFFMYNKFSKKEDINLIKGNGRVEARETTISSKFGGQIIKLEADEGDVVKKGQLLAEIDSRSLQANINSLKAKSEEVLKQISVIDAEIASVNTDIKFNAKELERTKTLIKQNFSSQLELDEDEKSLTKSKNSLNSLKAQKESLKASYDSILSTIKAEEINLADMKIYSPIDGVVLYKLVEDGEIISNNGKLFIIYNPDDLYMTIYMPSEKAGQVKVGEEAEIKLDAYSNKTFKAKVTFVADNAEFTPKEVETQKEREKLVFRIKLTLDNNSNREAKPGMPGDGFIELE